MRYANILKIVAVCCDVVLCVAYAVQALNRLIRQIVNGVLSSPVATAGGNLQDAWLAWRLTGQCVHTVLIK